jgi:hypothetical protein
MHALKYALATLIQGVASALRHQLFEHASHGFYSIHQMIQLRKLSLGERSPALRRASDVAETKEQVSDFSQCKTELTRTLNDCQAVKCCGVVSSLPAHPLGPGKQSNFLVVPNRRCLQSNLSRYLRNRQFGHKDVLDYPFPINIRTVRDSLQNSLDLKLTLSCSLTDRATERQQLCSRRRSTHAENEINIDARAVVDFRHHFGTRRAAAR